MNLSKTQILIFGGIGIFVLVLLLIVLGVIPVSKSKKKPSSSLLGGENVPREKLSVWIFNEEKNNFKDFIDKFNGANNAEVSLEVFAGKDYNFYFTSLLSAISAGQGPDVFMIPSTEIPLFLNKTTPLPFTSLPLVKLSQYFPQIVVNDVVFKDGIYGLPLSLDTLALIYNKDIFAKAGIVFPPDNWDTFVNVLKKVTVKDENGKILQAGAALGAANINNSQDILYAILMQLGSKITSEGKGSLLNEESQIAFRFFTQFSNPKNEYFTWDSNMPNSLDAFAQNKVAMIFDYQSALKFLKEKNSFLNIGISPFPQITSSDYYADAARYFVFVVSKHTKNSSLAWKFILSLTLDTQNVESYIKKSGKPPALLYLIEKYKNDPNLSVFTKQALYAKSWYGPNRNLIDKVFIETINSILNVSDEREFRNILYQAENKITAIINNTY